MKTMSVKLRGRVALTAAVVAFAMGTGCGSGEGTASDPIAKAQFIKKADAVCVRGSERFHTLYEQYVRDVQLHIAREKTTAQWAEIAKRALAPAVEGEVDEIHALGVPKHDGKQIGAILDALEEGVEKVEEHPRAMAFPGVMFERARGLAEKYGLAVCGRR